jgi:zinc protease
MMTRTRFFPSLVAGLLFVGVLSMTAAHATLPVQSWSTRSGAKVLFVESRSIPMIDINIDFDAGARYDPPAKSGLAALTHGLLPLGAGNLSEQEIADRMADAGAQRGGRLDLDRAGVSLRTLSSRSEREIAFATLASVVSAPRFVPEVLVREQARRISALKEEETKPEAIADRAFDRALYGDHPYGRNPTSASLEAITVADVQAFHSAHYGARRAVISMIGDLSRTEAEEVAERVTASLPPGTPAPALSAVPAPRAGEERIAHPASQSHILIGSAVLKRSDPDFFALTVGNYILGGGGFVSRLMAEVREKRGLAYSAYSYFSPRLQEGPFQAGLQTKKEQANEALVLVRKVIGDYVTSGPTEKELKAAKDNLVGGFALRIDSNRKILDNLANIGFYGLPLNYLDTWTANVTRVTAADIRAAFKRHVRSDALSTVVVGAP